MNAAMDTMLDRLAKAGVAEDAALGRRTWTPAEDAYIREHLGWLTDAEMGEALGRSESAVHLRWDREMRLPGPSKAPDVITAHKAAEALGVDAHKVAHWVDVGLIEGRIMAGGRNIRLIQRETFRRWVLNPMHWPYFNINKVRDVELHRLLQKRAARWGDEWWTTRRVADHHGVETADVKRYIHLGRIRSTHLPVSLGGRAKDRAWSNHFILRSEATRADLRFVHRGDDMSHLTPRGREWIKKALRMGWNATLIGRSMKKDPQTILNWIRRNFPKVKMPSGIAARRLNPRKV